MEKVRIAAGVYWVEIPEVDLRILCGCPADVIKHLINRGRIVSIEKNGVIYESGPNAILLSDVSIQNGTICNLAEFPVLQMLYRQGMLLPNHPNNTGAKPMLIGVEDQARAQSNYIYRGNYGLISQQEIMETGVSAKTAREMMRVKKRFAFDNMLKTDELLDIRIVDKDFVELREGVILHRRGVNDYEIISHDQKAEINLNLAPGEEYEPPFELGFHKLSREYFSIIHSGDGDGWDIHRPCMAAVISFQEKLFLIDAGPNIQHTLTALGISVNEIHGIFHTHAHDDHFAGLTTLVRSDRRVKYYATPLVRSSVQKKLSAMLSIDEEDFRHYFEVHDLVFDQWNNVEGLEVMPLYSPHPVETSIMYFRTLWEGGYKTYAHLADTAAFATMTKMLSDDPKRSGISTDLFERTKKQYLMPANLKKIDIGGSLIHGAAVDFTNDKSDKILLSHTAIPLTNAEKEIGSSATFGAEDILIDTSVDMLYQTAEKFLADYFAGAATCDLTMLLNCECIDFNPGSIIIRKEHLVNEIYLVLRGVAEIIDNNTRLCHCLSAGSILGDIAALDGSECPVTFRARSHVLALRIPRDIYVEFIRRNGLIEDVKRIHENRLFLMTTNLFGENVSYLVRNRIARLMQRHTLARSAGLSGKKAGDLYLVAKGELAVRSQSHDIETVHVGDYFGEEGILFGETKFFRAKAREQADVYVIPGDALAGIPIVRWKLQEAFERRIKSLSTRFAFEWLDAYSVSIRDIDNQHKEIFRMVDKICVSVDKGGGMRSLLSLIGKFRKLIFQHIDDEEALMKKHGYPEYNTQKIEHDQFRKDLAAWIEKLKDPVCQNASECEAFEAFIKNWLITHTLLKDKKYKCFFEGKGVCNL